MKIVIVSIYRPGSETGAAKISDVLSEELSKKNEVLYLCLGKKFKKAKKANNLYLLTIPSIPVKQGYAPKLTNKIVRQIYEELDTFAPDIIHAHHIAFTGLISLLWAKRTSTPYVLTLHSQPSQGAEYVFPRTGKRDSKPFKYSPTTRYLKRFFESCDLIISLNESIDKSVRSITKRAKLKRIRNGLFLDKYLQMPIKTSEDTKIFLFLGMYMPRKNQEFLIKTFFHLPENYKLLMHGNKKTGGDYVDKLQKIKKRTGAENVKIGGFIKGWSHSHTLKKTDYFVTASKKEVQSLVIIEALASGTPVIGLRNETMDELITSKNGLTLPKNTTPEMFAKKLMKFVIKNEGNYSTMGKVARKSVRSFNIKDVVKDMVQTYKSVIESSKVTKTTSESIIEKLIPAKLENLFMPLVKSTSKEHLPLKKYLYVTMAVAAIAWPLAKANAYLRDKR